MRRFYIQSNIGKAKYVVNHHDGNKKHGDGSDFFDVTIFKNKRGLAKFLTGLRSNGYIDGKAQANTTRTEPAETCATTDKKGA